ncbi:DUF1330 domain-containing protein [Pseudorhodoferax sp. Leaf265]|uniref:DUF1330 domain-containing protein n=1 Tax=Pseudorhodoferax sp. Leaf265 TaxID=1736315 RepID=UPI0006F42A3B|nr:DUF1330 domain-containing protein [Pseudorhodoferax sp. Leaf265]KQP12369.1 hypothetical protein ASF45_31815 [Pseudorhodoferax sp. Leaf265]
MVAEIIVSDSETFYSGYMPRVKPLLKLFEASVVIATNEVVRLEGELSFSRFLVLEFSSRDKAMEFYESPEYKEIAVLRFKSATTNLFLADAHKHSF